MRKLLQRVPPRMGMDTADHQGWTGKGLNRPGFEGAKQYALDRLTRELSPALVYHSLAHTRDEVAPAAERLAVLEGVEGEDLRRVLTAAYFHDIGFIEQPVDNEVISISIAEEALPRFDYNQADIQRICGMILATRLPQSPHILLEEIIADADLGVLGRTDYFLRTQDLRAELAGLGKPYSDVEWRRSQLEFMRAHRYFTRTARDLWEAKKQANIRLMEDWLDQSGVQIK